MKTSDHPAARARPMTAAEDHQPRQPEPVFVEQRAAELDETETAAEGGVPVASEQPQPTWEPIATAPRDGRDVVVRWGADDENGRLVRWRNGRHFTGRRWAAGGTWAASDSMMPLPASEPIDWLDHHLPEAAIDEPAEATA